MHVAEAEMMSRSFRARRRREYRAICERRSRGEIVLVPGGPFPAWATSNALPGVVAVRR